MAQVINYSNWMHSILIQNNEGLHFLYVINSSCVISGVKSMIEKIFIDIYKYTVNECDALHTKLSCVFNTYG